MPKPYFALLSCAALLCLAPLTAHAAGERYHVALDGTFAPHAMPTMSGGVEGFNVDLINVIGERLGAEIEITAAQFSGLIPGLQAGTYDFLAAPTTITPELSENLLFTEGYLDTDYQFVVKKGAAAITRLEDLEGRTIAVNKGSSYDAWAREHAGEYGWKVESYGSNSDAVQAVTSNRAFANLAGNTVAAYAVKRNPMVELSLLVPTGRVWAFPFRKGDEELRARIERVVECLKIDGTIAELAQKWFDAEPAPGSAAVTPQPGYGQPGYAGFVEDDHSFSCDVQA
ncbi:transporter substrate-binding domain-containing protein [Halotalea alkalilenta]|uniref:transporter substrate-binding domain-containing protein n=1 Tax=Halotalea alkalilenta TaxID=376489 RepID=UPI0006933070|nr:transporter substrate-binding domain-containing protein [Halotalea alkalilenta]